MKMAKRALAILMSFAFLFAFGFVVTAAPCTECISAVCDHDPNCDDCDQVPGCDETCVPAALCGADCADGGLGCDSTCMIPCGDECGFVDACTYVCDGQGPDCDLGYTCADCATAPPTTPTGPNCNICGDDPTPGECYCGPCGLPCCEIYAPGAPAFCECCQECWGDGCPYCQSWWQGIVQVLRIFTDWVANSTLRFFQFLGWLLTPVHWFLRYVVFAFMFM